MKAGNQSRKPAFVCVLVDGLNTLQEKSQTKGVYIEPVQVDEYRQTQPANLAKSRAWGSLEPGKIFGFWLLPENGQG